MLFKIVKGYYSITIDPETVNVATVQLPVVAVVLHPGDIVTNGATGVGYLTITIPDPPAPEVLFGKPPPPPPPLPIVMMWHGGAGCD